jgi:hypothetical protein
VKIKNLISDIKAGKHRDSLCSFGLLLFVFAVAVYYIVFLCKSELNADFSDTILWAKASYDSGKLVNPDFNYACFLPFGGSMLMLIFMPFFGFSYTTHALGMILFNIIFLAAAYIFFRKLRFNKIQSSVCVCVLTFVLVVSYFLRANFWGHIIYYALGALFLIIGMSLMISIIDMLDEEVKSKKLLITTIALCIFVYLTAINGIQAVVLFILPLVGGVLGERFLNEDVKLNDRKSIYLYKCAFCILICMFLGLLTAKFLTRNISMDYSAGYSSYASNTTWGKNVIALVPGWYQIMGVTTWAGDPMLSIKSVFNIIKIVFATMLFWIPFYMLLNYNKIKDRFTRIMLIAHLCIMVFLLIGWVFGELAVWIWRLIPICFTATIMYILFVRDIIVNGKKIRLAIAYSALILIVVVYSLGNIFYNIGLTKQSVEYALEMVEKAGVKNGYASFWNANYINFISEGEYRVGNVKIDGENVEKVKFQCYNSWYEDAPDANGYFLLLKPDEYYELVNADSELLAKATDIKEDVYYTMLIFDENIF